MNRVSKKQILEWTENPVTEVFKLLAEKERDELEGSKGLNAFHPFRPERTQEILANLNGAVDTWDTVIAALEGEGIMEIDDDSDGTEDARFE